MCSLQLPMQWHNTLITQGYQSSAVNKGLGQVFLLDFRESLSCFVEFQCFYYNFLPACYRKVETKYMQILWNPIYLGKVHTGLARKVGEFCAFEDLLNIQGIKLKEFQKHQHWSLLQGFPTDSKWSLAELRRWLWDQDSTGPVLSGKKLRFLCIGKNNKCK